MGTASAAWLALGVGILFGADVAWVLLVPPAADDSPEPAASTARPPVDWVSTGGGWNTSQHGSSEAGVAVRVVELGSTTGAVQAGAPTELCARVVDGAGSNLAGAHVRFAAERGTLTVSHAQTDGGGMACIQFNAPAEAGTVPIEATAEYANTTSSTARNVVEVISDASGGHQHGGAAQADGLGLPAIALALAGMLGSLPRRTR